MRLANKLMLALVTVLSAGLWTGRGEEPEAAAEEDLRLRVVLYHAFPRGDEKVRADAPSGTLIVRRTGGVWERVGVTAGNYNQHDHHGYVDRAEVVSAGVKLDLALQLRSDGWHRGGRFVGEVDLTRGEGDALSGTYRATFRGTEVEGRAEAVVLPEPRRHAAPPEPRERPRLLFRAGDLPDLRARAETPFGRLALARMEDSAAGSAFRFALTGDAALAADARVRIEALMKDRGHGPNAALSRPFAWRIEQAAIAFDLCYDAWDEAFRREVADYLYDMANLLLYNRGMMHRAINWGHGGPHAPALHWASAVAGLALAGEPGPEPSPPQPPYLITEAGGRIPPAEGYRPGEGVSVIDFESDVMPRAWIYAGAFPEADAPLATPAQRGAARPALGQRLGEGEAAREWRRPEAEKLLYTGRHSRNRTVVELTGPSGVVTRSISYYYLVLRNDRDRWVRVHTGHGGVQVYLGGVRLGEGDLVHLQAGLYPWLFTGPIGEVNPWAKAFAEPKLIEVDETEVAVARAAAEAAHKRRRADWRHVRGQWERSGGADVRYSELAAASAHVMDMVFAELLGRGGHMSGGRTMLAMDGPNKYAFMHRNATGLTPGLFGEVADYIPRTMFVFPYREDRELVGQEVNGRPGFVTAAYPDGERDLASEHFATLFPLLREEWQPVALWAWMYHTGGSLENEEGMRKLLATPGRPYSFREAYGSFDTHPIYAFLNAPLDMAPRPPEAVMPRTWSAPDRGFYGFRNEWTGRDGQFIAQFFSSTYAEGAGTLRVAGLGHIWSHGDPGAAPEHRFFENVVQLPGHDILAPARGRVTHHETRPDGSGALSVDLADVYAAPVRDDRGRVLYPYEWYGDVRRPHRFGESGLSGLRAMAVDYSGASGAPCLIVLADRIEGAESAIWAWQLESQSEGIMQKDIDAEGEGRHVFRKEHFDQAFDGQLLLTTSRPIEDDRVEVHPDGFTFRQGTASMRATFIAPGRPRVEVAERVQYHRTNVEVIRRDASRGVFVEGDGKFLVVLTFQEDPAPEVRVTRGQGLDATVRVGGQTVRFDAANLVLGD